MRLKFGLLFLLLSSTLFSQNMFGVAVGFSQFTATSDGPYKESNPPGISVALLVPIHLPKMDVHFKSKVVTFGEGMYVENDFSEFDTFLWDRLTMLSNTFMFGKRLGKSPDWSILPQIGFGGRAEIGHDDWSWGSVFLDAVFDFSFLVERRFDFINLGLLANLEMDKLGDSASLLSGKRFGLALVISK
jgi:hypothetical protein